MICRKRLPDGDLFSFLCGLVDRLDDLHPLNGFIARGNHLMQPASGPDKMLQLVFVALLIEVERGFRLRRHIIDENSLELFVNAEWIDHGASLRSEKFTIEKILRRLQRPADLQHGGGPVLHFEKDNA